MKLQEPIYISGPMTGIKNYNKKAFQKAEKKLKSLGYKNIENPIKIGDALSLKLNKKLSEITYDEFIIEDLKHLKRSKTIVLLEGWKNSKGCNIELAMAKKQGLEIYHIKNL